jgi:hypothetical protein
MRHVKFVWQIWINNKIISRTKGRGLKQKQIFIFWRGWFFLIFFFLIWVLRKKYCDVLNVRSVLRETVQITHVRMKYDLKDIEQSNLEHEYEGNIDVIETMKYLTCANFYNTLMRTWIPLYGNNFFIFK